MTDPTVPDAELIERLARLLPVSWDNEVDGHGEPTHAVLTFGEHQTQAITLCPDDWMVLNDIASRLAELQADRTRLLGLISEESIERLATDIAIACVDCRQEIREARHRAMVRLGERLRNPLPNDYLSLARLA